MSLLNFAPSSLANSANSKDVLFPTLPESLRRGMTGFTFMSLAGFAPWPIMERWFRHAGEVQLYIACTVVFVGLSAPCLRRLIIGPPSSARFYALFFPAFLAYAIGYVGFWMGLRGGEGEWLGGFAGTMAMGAVLCSAFRSFGAFPKVAAALFILHGAGYAAGGKLEGLLAVNHRIVAIALWALCYGLGFGAGFGLAVYFCQERARKLAPQEFITPGQKAP